MAFSCKGRGFCPSCTGRRMNATAANLIERVLPPQSGLRQWVLTFPFPWRRRLAQDGALPAHAHSWRRCGVLRRRGSGGCPGAKTGAVTACRGPRRISVNPHLHLVALDGAWHGQGGELSWQGLAPADERGRRRAREHRPAHRAAPSRRGLLGIDEDGADPDVPGDPESSLAASAVSGRTPPAGPQWVSRLAPLEPHDLAYDKPLCASLDGFTLHAVTRAGASTRRAARRSCATCCARRSPRSGSSRAPTAGAHHPEEGVHRRDDRGRHGPAVAAVPAWPPACLRHACTPCATRACSRRPVRGGPRSRRCRPRRSRPRRAPSPTERAGRRIPPVGGTPGAHLLRGRARVPPVRAAGPSGSALRGSEGRPECRRTARGRAGP